MKSKTEVSSFFGGSRSRTAEVGDGFGKDSGSAICDSSSNDFSSSLGRSSKIFVRILHPELVETCKNESPEAVLRCFEVFLLRPIKKC
jgi:hypothetical protein